MKNSGKRLLCALLTAAALSAGMSALAVSENVKVKIFSRPVFVEGQQVYVEDANGKDTYYLTYNGTTYIPLRMAGNWMGKNVSWDGATRTVTLDGSTLRTYRTESTSIQDKDEWKQGTDGDGLSATLEKDIQIVIDGKARTFQNTNGQPVYPLSFKNTIYLPVRNIGELLGMTVTYRARNDAIRQYEAIFMRTAMTDAQIAAGEAYLKTMWQCFSYDALKAQGRTTAGMDARYKIDSRGDIFEYMSECNDVGLEELKTFAQIGIEQMQIILATPKPDCPVLEASFDELDERARAGKEACERVLAAIDAGEDVAACRALMINRNSAGGAQEGATEVCRDLTISFNIMERVLHERL